MVKYREGTWQEIGQIIQRAQETQQKWYDEQRPPAPEYVILEDVLHGRSKKADRLILNYKNLH